MRRLGRRRLDGEPAVGRALLPAVARRTRRRRPRRLLDQPQTGRRAVRGPVPGHHRYHHGRPGAAVVSPGHQRHFQFIDVVPHGAPRTEQPVRTGRNYIIITPLLSRQPVRVWHARSRCTFGAFGATDGTRATRRPPRDPAMCVRRVARASLPRLTTTAAAAVLVARARQTRAV